MALPILDGYRRTCEVVPIKAINYISTEPREELARFEQASDNAVRRAKEDRNVAIEFLRGSRYSEMMPGELKKFEAQNGPMELGTGQ